MNSAWQSGQVHQNILLSDWYHCVLIMTNDYLCCPLSSPPILYYISLKAALLPVCFQQCQLPAMPTRTIISPTTLFSQQGGIGEAWDDEHRFLERREQEIWKWLPRDSLMKFSVQIHVDTDKKFLCNSSWSGWMSKTFVTLYPMRRVFCGETLYNICSL